MRSMIVGMGLVALVVAAFGQPATAAKTKMGCEIGKEVWNASIGKCEPGTPKPRKAAKKATEKKK